MTDERKQLLQRMARAAYAYATERSHATWDGKRPGLRYEGANGLSIRSCGAYRAWAILACDGTVGWCVDGFRQRETQNETGGVCVLLGDGKFIFPPDDSRSNHSLRFRVEGAAKICWVTDEPAVPWESRIEAMAEELEAAVERLRVAVAEYDMAEREATERSRADEVLAAAQLLEAK